MAVRSNAKVDGIPEVVEDAGLVIEPEIVYNEPEQSIRVVCRFPATIKETGQVTGKQYLWAGPGSELDVDMRDWPALKDKRIGKHFCCGSGNDNLIFAEIV